MSCGFNLVSLHHFLMFITNLIEQLCLQICSVVDRWHCSQLQSIIPLLILFRWKEWQESFFFLSESFISYLATFSTCNLPLSHFDEWWPFSRASRSIMQGLTQLGQVLPPSIPLLQRYYLNSLLGSLVQGSWHQHSALLLLLTCVHVSLVRQGAHASRLMSCFQIFVVLWAPHDYWSTDIIRNTK